MPSDQPPETKFEIGHVLFIDIVGYSKLLIEEQKERLGELTSIVLATAQVRESTDEQLVRLPTGDGMALVFRHSAAEPARCALEIAEALRKHPEIPVRMGIHSGPVSEVTDVSGRSNLAGAGINMAQRVMDCGDAGHILLSQHVADDLIQYRQWAPRLRDLGECEVKHGVRLRLVNLYAEPLGNPEPPDKFRNTLITPPVRNRFSSKQLLWIAAGSVAAAAIVAFALFQMVRRDRSGPDSHQARLIDQVKDSGRSPSTAGSLPISDKSIAVLPFQNLSSDKENAYFVEGIQDEILTRLAKIGALKVISRTSTAHFASSPANLPEIAHQLGVANILEGSVQRAGAAVHVNVQLIKAATDDHLWAETYDRTLENIFSVEGEIAQTVAEALKATLTGAEQQVLAEKPTKIPAAYDAYLRGIGNFQQGNGESAKVALGAFEEAVRLDPGFAAAWAALSRTHSIMFFKSDVTPGHRAAAEKALAEATRLQPNLAETQLAAASFRYWVVRDYPGALEMMQRLRETWPNNAELLEVMAFLSARLGQWKSALDFIQQSAVLNPRDLYTRIQTISLQLPTRNTDAAVETADRALRDWPNDTNLLGLKVAAFQMRGNLDAAQSVVSALVPSVSVTHLDTGAGAIAYQAKLRRDPEIARKLFESLKALPEPKGPESLGVLAELEEMFGQKAESQKTFARLREQLESQLKGQPDSGDLVGALAYVLARLGERDAALRELEKRKALSEGDARAMGATEDLRARILILSGDKTGAISSLERILAKPNDGFGGPPLTPALLRLDPDFDPLRGDPRFEKLCQETH